MEGNLISPIRKSIKAVSLALIGGLCLLQASTLFASNNSEDYNFTTIVDSVDLGQISTVKTVFHKDANLLFFSGQKNESSQSGFFNLDLSARGSVQYKLPIDSTTDENTKYGIHAVTTGPFQNSLVLSYKTEGDKTAQYLSKTFNGTLWNTQKILQTDKHYTDIVSTNVYGIKHFIVYGKDHNSLLTSIDGNFWGTHRLPNICNNTDKCTITNQFMGGVVNGYLLLQSSLSETQTDAETDSDADSKDGSAKSSDLKLENKLLFSLDLFRWYVIDTPFSSSKIQSVYKTHENGLLVSVDSEGKHSLWFTKDYKSWNEYELSANSTVLDAKTGYKNFVVLSLGHDNVSDIVILDPDTKEQTVFASFAGNITGMDWYNESLYLSGDFVNFVDNTRALLVNMTKKTGDSNSACDCEDCQDGKSCDDCDKCKTCCDDCKDGKCCGKCNCCEEEKAGDLASLTNNINFLSRREVILDTNILQPLDRLKL